MRSPLAGGGGVVGTQQCSWELWRALEQRCFLTGPIPHPLQCSPQAGAEEGSQDWALWSSARGHAAQEPWSSPLLGLPQLPPSSDPFQHQTMTKPPGAISAKLYTVRNILTSFGVCTTVSGPQGSFLCPSEDAQVSHPTGVSETPGITDSVVGHQSLERP